MKNTSLKRILSLALAFVLMVSAVPFFSIPASAATSKTVEMALRKELPLVTYAMSSASRVYSYSDSSLSTQTTGYYIDTFKDQIVIQKVSSDGRAVYVTYPSSSASSGYRSRWFATDDIICLTKVDFGAYTATAKATTYRMNSGSSLASYGSIAVGDTCYTLGNHASGKVPTVYPISSTTVNGVSGIKYKLALADSTQSGNSNNNNGSNSGSSNLSDVQRRLKAIGTGELKLNDNTDLVVGHTFVGTRSNEQCKGYARNLFNMCFGINIGSTQGNNYKLDLVNGVSHVGTVTKMTTQNISALFAQARPGDFVQMKRGHGGPHSMIIYSVKADGINVLEANTDGRNTICASSYTWSDLCNKNAAMSVYTASNYKLK